MSGYCAPCQAEVVGNWQACPLCHERLSDESPVGSGESRAEAYPATPLRFDRRKLRLILMWLSLLAVAGSFAIQLVLPDLVGEARTIWLSLATLWLVVLTTVYRRRNIGSLVIWLVLLLSAAAIARDLVVAGTISWATTWAIPAICTFANLALGLVTVVVRLEPAEHLVKLVLVLLFGLVPGLFIAFGWVTVVLPSQLSLGFSIVLLGWLTALHRRELSESLRRQLRA